MTAQRRRGGGGSEGSGRGGRGDPDDRAGVRATRGSERLSPPRSRPAGPRACSFVSFPRGRRGGRGETRNVIQSASMSERTLTHVVVTTTTNNQRRVTCARGASAGAATTGRWGGSVVDRFGARAIGASSQTDDDPQGGRFAALMGGRRRRTNVKRKATSERKKGQPHGDRYFSIDHENSATKRAAIPEPPRGRRFAEGRTPAKGGRGRRAPERDGEPS